MGFLDQYLYGLTPEREEELRWRERVAAAGLKPPPPATNIGLGNFYAPAEPEPSFWQDVAVKSAQDLGRAGLGSLELMAQLGTMSYGIPTAGIAGMVDTAFKGPEQGADTLNKMSSLLMYQPQTEYGKAGAETFSYPFQKLGEIGDPAGEYVMEKTQPYVGEDLSAALGATTKSLFEASPLLAGPAYRGARNLNTALGEAGEVTIRPKLSGTVTVDPQRVPIGAGLKEEFVPRKTAKGVVGAPGAMNKAIGDFLILGEQLQKDLTALAKRGAKLGGADYWDRWVDGLIALSGGDMEVASRLANVSAVLSANRSPFSEGPLIAKAYVQWLNGQEITGIGTKDMTRAVRDAFEGKGLTFGSQKLTSVGQITQKLMADRARAAGLEVRGATPVESATPGDIWVGRAHGYVSDKDFSAPQSAFMESQWRDVGKKTGLPPHQAQAAAWTASIPAFELTEPAATAEAVRRGWGTMEGREFVPNPDVPNAAYMKQLLHREMALKTGHLDKRYVEQFARDNQSLDAILWSNAKSLSLSPTPGEGTGLFPQLIGDVPRQVAWGEVLNKHLPKQAIIDLAKAQGIPVIGDIVQGVASWGGQGEVSWAIPAVIELDKTGQVVPYQKKGLAALVTTLAGNLSQNAGAYFAASKGGGPVPKNSIWLQGNLTPEQIVGLSKNLTDRYGGDPSVAIPIHTPKGLVVKYTGPAEKIPEFRNNVRAAIQEGTEADVHLRYLHGDSDVWFHGEEGGPYGSNFVREGRNGRGHQGIGEFNNLLSPRIEAAVQEWINSPAGRGHTPDLSARRQFLWGHEQAGGPYEVRAGATPLPPSATPAGALGSAYPEAATPTPPLPPVKVGGVEVPPSATSSRIGDFYETMKLGREREGFTAALRDPVTGEVYTGSPIHGKIPELVKDAMVKARLSEIVENVRGGVENPNEGFLYQGKYIPRAEAERVAAKNPELVWESGQVPGLDWLYNDEPPIPPPATEFGIGDFVGEGARKPRKRKGRR